MTPTPTTFHRQVEVGEIGGQGESRPRLDFRGPARRTSNTSARRFFRLLLDSANFGVHPHVLAPALLQPLGVVEIVATRCAERGGVELRRPFAERIAEPR